MINLASLIPVLAEAAKNGAEGPTFGVADFFFAFFGAIAILSALMVITAESPVSSALFLVVTFFAVAAEYALLSAHFLAVIQVLVYAGAIMVLFLFVIMLLDLRKEELIEKRHWILGAVGFVIGIALVVLGGFTFVPSQKVEVVVKSEADPNQLEFGKFPAIRVPEGEPGDTRGADAGFGTTKRVGKHLFREYLFPFEVASLLLLIGIIGVVVISRRRIKRRPEGVVDEEEGAS